jgi:hypothetical protein
MQIIGGKNKGRFGLEDLGTGYDNPSSADNSLL